MSEKKPKIITKSSTNKNKKKNKSKKNGPIIIVSLDQITPRTRKIIAKFVRDIIDEEKKNELNNEKKSFSPFQTKIKNKLNYKEESQAKTPIKAKEVKYKETNKVKDKKNMNNSAQKIKSKNSGVNYLNKKNNININININNGRFNKAKTKTSNTMINPHVSYDNLDKKEKKEKKNNKKTMKTENNFKAPSNIEKLGKKMIKEEIAQEKKTTVEKLKIIKMHILSLKKKEEELTNKLIKLNNQENALSKNDKDNKEKTENLEKEGKIENIPKIEKEEKNNKNEDKNERDEDKIIPDQKEKQIKCENDKKEINNIEKKEEVIDKEKNPKNEKVQKEVKYNDEREMRKKNVKNSKKNSLTKEKQNNIKTKTKIQSAKILLEPIKNVKLRIQKDSTPEKRSKNVGIQNVRINSNIKTNKKTKK